MASETPGARETQEQSIKARKKELFQAEPPPVAPAGPQKSIKDYLRTAKAAPMTPGAKAALWIAGVLVVLLFVAALVTSGSRHPRRRHRHSGEVAVHFTQLLAMRPLRKVCGF